ncbi:MAG: DUF2220 family protein [Bacteroidales bacterium]
MVTADQIRKKAISKYTSFLQAIVRGEELFPLAVPCNMSVDKNFIKYCEEVENLISTSIYNKGFGYDIEFQKTNHRVHGEQDLPSRILFQNRSEYLRFLGKEAEVVAFTDNLKLLLDTFPQLEEWAGKNVIKIVDNNGIWGDIIKVLRYFKSTPFPDLYIRELPVEVHTKFIEDNKTIIRALLDVILHESEFNNDKSDFCDRFNLKRKEARVRFRLLDTEISVHYPYDDMEVPVSQFNHTRALCSKVFIVENEMTFLTFPFVKDSIVVWGKGFQLEVLKQNTWLSDIPIFYWGDMDAAGMQILHQLRSYFPHVNSFLMDQQTYNDHKAFSVEVISDKYPDILGALTNEEHDFYQFLRTNNKRLEQERIGYLYAMKRIGGIM